ncbi:PKD domain-containing protein [Acidobacteria bacterium ACD]|nr:MAG: PKD domain-containing protein [Acidobacteriota bacterium]MCE7957112.1 PKD domain-containing protein [Acidobacteria bacterium ACB2]MDL1950262.1 PKD domain-containing protein [Acidobacteria bacterium ACD]
MSFRLSLPAAVSAMALALLLAPAPLLASDEPGAPLAVNPAPPSSPVKLIFIHHSTGENWLNDENGALGPALRDANYFVSDTNYDWGPADLDSPGDEIGSHTDIGNYYSWFAGSHRDTYLGPLYVESGQNCWYSRLEDDPGGPNRIVMFKSCFPNSKLTGSPSDPIPPIGSNPLRHQDCYSEHMTLANAKGIYQSLLTYFATRTDKLFVLVVQPPLNAGETDSTEAANARALASWLVDDWLDGYPHRNVAVFDFFNVLTSNGGSTRTNDPTTNDLGWSDGNHHRVASGAIEHLQTVANNYSAYGSAPDDSHPSQAGNQKATGEFVTFLNAAYHCWQGTGGCPGGSSTCTLTCSHAVPSSATAGASVTFSATSTATGCTGATTYDWDYGDLSAHGTTATTTHTYSAPGTYSWTLTVTAGGQTCTRTGQVVVSGGASACTADGQTLCLNQSRFRVKATYRDYGGNSGNAQAVPLTNDTGYFWFFGRDNVEVVIKVLDFCGVSSAWAVYAAGLTDVGIVLTVTDTTTGAVKSYPNELGIPFVLVRDAAFPCP